jgi:hypothetical protein
MRSDSPQARRCDRAWVAITSVTISLSARAVTAFLPSRPCIEPLIRTIPFNRRFSSSCRSLRICRSQASILAAPGVEGSVRDPLMPIQFRDLSPAVRLLQDSDDQNDR